ncbi:MAG: hypothetical protein V4723_17720 [Pseudomonadota bacterium]
MTSLFKYKGFLITIETLEDPPHLGKPAWSATYKFSRDGQLVQAPVAAASRQKSEAHAEQKALRFAAIAIDTLSEYPDANTGRLTAQVQPGRPHQTIEGNAGK